MKGPLKSPLRIQHGGANFLDMKNIQYILDQYVKPNLSEQIRLLPDSIFYGSLILALVTQSYAMAIFAVSLLEAGLIGTGLRNLISYMDLIRSAPEIPADPAYCDSSFRSPTIESMLHFGPASIQSAFPSFPIYFLSVAGSYVITSMMMQKEELEALGPAYASCFYIGIASVLLLILIVSSYRMIYGCERVGVVILTLLTGFLIGGLITYQMNQLLGRNAINLTGIPLLRERTRDGKPLYVCPQKVGQ
jgi:hypothetical protein